MRDRTRSELVQWAGIKKGSKTVLTKNRPRGGDGHIKSAFMTNTTQNGREKKDVVVRGAEGAGGLILVQISQWGMSKKYVQRAKEGWGTKKKSYHRGKK